MNECRFCTNIKFKRGIIWENKYFYAQFDSNPVSPGHALLIPKNHIEKISDLKKKESDILIILISDVKKVIEKTDLENMYSGMLNESSESSKKFIKQALLSLKLNSKISGYNYGVNEGEAAGQTLNHLHVHIIPRYLGDIEDPIGGVRNTIPGMGNYRKF